MSIQLSGWVLDNLKNPVVAATVNAYAATSPGQPAGGALYSTTTDGNGHWAVTGMVTQAYDVNVDKSGTGFWEKGLSDWNINTLTLGGTSAPAAGALQVIAGGVGILAGGLIITAGGETITAGGLTITAGGEIISGGDLAMGAAAGHLTFANSTSEVKFPQVTGEKIQLYDAGAGSHYGMGVVGAELYFSTPAGTVFGFRTDNGSGARTFYIDTSGHISLGGATSAGSLITFPVIQGGLAEIFRFSSDGGAGYSRLVANTVGGAPLSNVLQFDVANGNAAGTHTALTLRGNGSLAVGVGTAQAQQTDAVNLNNSNAIAWRNVTNTGDLSIIADTSNRLAFIGGWPTGGVVAAGASADSLSVVVNGTPRKIALY